jgi:hypothetical protein
MVAGGAVNDGDGTDGVTWRMAGAGVGPVKSLEAATFDGAGSTTLVVRDPRAAAGAGAASVASAAVPRRPAPALPRVAWPGESADAEPPDEPWPGSA